MQDYVSGATLAPRSVPSLAGPRMPDTPRWRRYLRFWGPDIDADIDDELRFHLELMSPSTSVNEVGAKHELSDPSSR